MILLRDAKVGTADFLLSLNQSIVWFSEGRYYENRI